MNNEEAAQGGDAGGMLEEHMHSYSMPEADGNDLLHMFNHKVVQVQVVVMDLLHLLLTLCGYAPLE